MNDKTRTSKSLINMHLIFASVSFVIFSVFLLLSSKELGIHYFQGKVLAITHIATLCWLTSFLFALLYHFTPVLFSRKLFSLFLAKIGFWIFALGSLSLVAAFWMNKLGGMLIGSAHLLSIPFLILFINVIITAIKAKKLAIEQWFFVLSVIWLLLTVTIGILLAMNFKSPIFEGSHLEWLKLHANIGFIGWFILFIIGVSANSVKSNEQKKKTLLQISFYLINLGLILYLFYQGHQQTGVLEFPLFIIVAGIIFVLIYLHNNHFFKLPSKSPRIYISLFFLSIPIIIASYIIFSTSGNYGILTRAGVVYGVSFILGVIGLWSFKQFNDLLMFPNPVFSKNNGENQLKKQSDQLQKVHLIIYLLATLTLIMGIAFKQEIVNIIAAVFMIGSSLLFNLLLFKALFVKS